MTDGKRIYNLIRTLLPIQRSICGEGSREVLKVIKKHLPIAERAVKTGSRVFDWTVPKEWQIRDAYIKDGRGKKIVDFKKSPLHVVSHSTAVNKKMSLSALKKHLFTLPDHPAWIPYRTSYYQENWGFCLAHRELRSLKAGKYEVHIDSELKAGHLDYGELLIKGKTKQEFLLSTYFCHPAMANDNQSGVALLTMLAKKISTMNPHYSYRVLFVPETIGSLAWLQKNQKQLKNIKHGLVVTCVGDKGMLTYKKSRQGDAEIDLVAEKVLAESGQKYRILDFYPMGSDERQYCSPAFNLPVGSLMRTPYGQYPEYHTSADNLSIISEQPLEETFKQYVKIIEAIDQSERYINRYPKGEAFLGGKNLYRNTGGRTITDAGVIFWILNFSDGHHSLLDISIRSKLPLGRIRRAAAILEKHKLIAEIF